MSVQNCGWDDVTGTIDPALFLQLTGDQTVDGVKTMDYNPIVQPTLGNPYMINLGNCLQATLSSAPSTEVTQTSGVIVKDLCPIVGTLNVPYMFIVTGSVSKNVYATQVQVNSVIADEIIATTVVYTDTTISTVAKQVYFSGVFNQQNTGDTLNLQIECVTSDGLDYVLSPLVFEVIALQPPALP